MKEKNLFKRHACHAVICIHEYRLCIVVGAMYKIRGFKTVDRVLHATIPGE